MKCVQVVMKCVQVVVILCANFCSCAFFGACLLAPPFFGEAFPPGSVDVTI